MNKLNKIYKEMLSEDLEYSKSDTKGEEDDEYTIGTDTSVVAFNSTISEDISIPNLRMSKNIKISDEEKQQISNINPNNLKISQGDYDGKIVNMIVNLPWESQVNNGGVIADIQVINIKDTNLYQIHIELSEAVRGLGLGYKVYSSLIQDLGHLYSGKGRQMNTSEIPKIWNKLRQNNSFECYDNENGTICMIKGNPDKEKLMNVTGYYENTDESIDLGKHNPDYNDDYNGYSY